MSEAARKLRHSGIVLFVPRSVRRALPYHLKKNRELLCARVRAGGSVGSPDYMKMLLPSKESERPRSEVCLLANPNVIIVAGFDPLTSLTAVVHYMLVDGEKYRRLTDEVRGAFSAYDPITNQEPQSLRYLYSVLEEGLRLHTLAAFGLPRISPGAMVDGRWIPKGEIYRDKSKRGSRGQGRSNYGTQKKVSSYGDITGSVGRLYCDETG
jgi:Cytochrome P450